MNDKLIKTLSASAAGVQLITVFLTYFIYANQEAAKTVFSGAQEIIGIHSVPVPYFIACICPMILYFAFTGFLAYKENRKTGTKTGAIVFFVLACVIEIGMESVTKIGNLWVAREGVGALASYSTLGTAISMCTRPFCVVAFGLFALSAGGSLVGTHKSKTMNENTDYAAGKEWMI